MGELPMTGKEVASWLTQPKRVLALAAALGCMGAAHANQEPPTDVPPGGISTSPTISPPVDGPTIGPTPPGPICEYVPEQKRLPTVGCGFNDLGLPKAGIYICGKVSKFGECKEECTLDHCEE